MRQYLTLSPISRQGLCVEELMRNLQVRKATQSQYLSGTYKGDTSYILINTFYIYTYSYLPFV